MFISAESDAADQLFAYGGMYPIGANDHVAFIAVAITEMANRFSCFFFDRGNLVVELDAFSTVGVGEHRRQRPAIYADQRCTILFRPVAGVLFVKQLAFVVVVKISVQFHADGIVLLTKP